MNTNNLFFCYSKHLFHHCRYMFKELLNYYHKIHPYLHVQIFSRQCQNINVTYYFCPIPCEIEFFCLFFFNYKRGRKNQIGICKMYLAICSVQCISQPPALPPRLTKCVYRGFNLSLVFAHCFTLLAQFLIFHTNSHLIHPTRRLRLFQV